MTTLMNGAATLTLSKCLPGRLGDDSKSFLTDNRLDPRIREKWTKIMGEGEAPPPTEFPELYEECLAYAEDQEKKVTAMFDMMSTDLPPEVFEDISVEKTTVIGVDGNFIDVEIRRPVGVDKPLPCILHVHGGGMTIMSSREKIFLYIEAHLARMGAIVVNVEFRNAGRQGEREANPFPAGLNDCVSVIEWISNNRKKLGYSSFILMGESGGGNLVIASAMKLLKEKDVSVIDGVFAMCPFISNAYHAKKNGKLLSLIENDDYFLSVAELSTFAKIYTIKTEDAVNPLAWPLHASPEDLRGLPPFFISLNELDPLRDEGKAFYIKLVDAGVSATCHIVCGTEHGGDIFDWNECPDIVNATMRNIISFAKSFEEDK